MKSKRWTVRFITIPPLLLGLIFAFNFIIDPYSVTPYNLLKIPNKFARDDRIEKVSHLSKSEKYDAIILGSSRVYSYNPLQAEQYLKTSVYNAGVGTALVEDHLGFLLYLERINKFPSLVILGIDFYSFNPEVPTNPYFLRNNDLNFMHKRTDSTEYLSKFLSTDALRASYKTVLNYLFHPGAKPRFNTYGSKAGTETLFGFPPLNRQEVLHFSKNKISKELRFIKTAEYPRIDALRLQYLQHIFELVKKHHADIILFVTPISSDLLHEINTDSVLKTRLEEFKTLLLSYGPYYDFTTDNRINDDAFYFSNPTHTTAIAGNLVLARILHQNDADLPKDFGVYHT
ncbi:MAG TPA: hypothetical protein ENL02_02630, partial [Epsilonproteobacteria bacterium]|nr:hypothetical protein [Campylobacterota bacterium]